LTLLLVIAGCAIAEDLAKDAPQAKPPEAYQTAKLHKWPDDVSYWSDGFTFELFVKHGFANELTLTGNGVRLTRFDGADPDNDKKAVYLATDLEHDTTAKTTRSHYVIFPKRSADGTPGQPHGQVNEYKLVERSINPSYKGTPGPCPNPNLRCPRKGVRHGHARFHHDPSAEARTSFGLDDRRQRFDRVRTGSRWHMCAELPDVVVDLHQQLPMVGVDGRLLCAEVPGGVVRLRRPLLISARSPQIPSTFD
jgi:hypothetical protein